MSTRNNPLLFLLLGFCLACEKEVPERITTKEAVPIVLTKAQEGFRDASNSFGIEVFRNVYKDALGKDVICSPFSLSMALAMSAQGAKADTWNQFAAVLNWGNASKEDIADYYKAMISGLAKADPAVGFGNESSVWITSNYVIKPDYKKTLSSYFSAESYETDFSKAASVDLINNWVASKTEGKITQMLTELDPQTRLLLLNALLFKGPWSYETTKAKKDKFYGNAGESQKDFFDMSCEIIGYEKRERYEVFRLPYGNGSYDMTVLLPSKGVLLQDIVEDLHVSALLPHDYASAHVHFPCFSLSWDSGSKLIINALQKTGLTLPFSSNADFSDIHDNLMITSILQKTTIDVNEQGTEFEAATLVQMGDGAAGTVDIKEIGVNRPFLFAIRETSSDTFLLIGTVSN